MNKKTRYIIYILLLIILIYNALNELGFFDKKVYKTKIFSVKKPFLYRSILSPESNNKKNSFEKVIFLSIFNNKSASYDIIKFNLRSFKHITLNDLKLKNINIQNCYIVNKNEKIDLYSYHFITIYKYPYYINFTEINKKRENNIIKQVCKNNKMIVINQKK